MARTRIGELLMSQGRIDSLQLASALAHQRQWGGRIGNAIVRLGFLPPSSSSTKRTPCSAGGAR